MTEKELLGSVIDLARTLGWRVAHFRSVEATFHDRGGRQSTRWITPVQADGKGFPDLLLVRERVLAVEVKGGSHKPTKQQAEWLAAFRLAGVRGCVWTPASWQNGEVGLELGTRIPYLPVEDAA